MKPALFISVSLLESYINKCQNKSLVSFISLVSKNHETLVISAPLHLRKSFLIAAVV